MEARKSSHVNEKKYGPERTYFYQLRGKKVKLKLVSGEELMGPLRWVDRFTLCIKVEAGNLEQKNKDVLVYKHAVEKVFGI